MPGHLTAQPLNLILTSGVDPFLMDLPALSVCDLVSILIPDWRLNLKAMLHDLGPTALLVEDSVVLLSH